MWNHQKNSAEKAALEAFMLLRKTSAHRVDIGSHAAGSTPKATFEAL